MERTPSILIVEDDIRLAEMMREFFGGHGFDVSLQHRGDTAIDSIVRDHPDLVVLDIALPGADGFAVCRSVRADYDGLILMLTARDDDIDQIVGLEIGADDYVTKPVEPRVLLARVRSLLRRRSKAAEDQAPAALDFGHLQIRPGAREVFLDDAIVELSTTEFDLLLLLARSAGQVVSRDALFQELRGLPYDGQDRSVDVAISRLRKKLDDESSQPRRIKAVRGKGYLFVAENW